MSPHRPSIIVAVAAVFLVLATLATDTAARDLDQIQQSGQIRHLGIRYANFVTGSGDGLDVDVARLFAERLGVEYVFVESDWSRIIPDLVGREVVRDGDLTGLGDSVPVRGDLIATGMTVLPWRAELVDFSAPMFPTQIWLITVADAALEPIAPSGDPAAEIRRDGTYVALVEDYYPSVRDHYPDFFSAQEVVTP